MNAVHIFASISSWSGVFLVLCRMERLLIAGGCRIETRCTVLEEAGYIAALSVNRHQGLG